MPYRLNLAVSLALFVPVLGFEEDDLIHGGNEAYSVDDALIIADFKIYSGLLCVF